jgi:DegV family protein with EDD domain
MKYRIVSDSSSIVYELPGSIEYRSVPLKIMADGVEFVDVPETDVAAMVNAVEHAQKTSSSCPSTGEFLQACEGADCVFGITITSGLSGSYNSACMAAEQFREENPDASIYIIDSLATGGKPHLMIDKLKELMEQGLSFEEIKTAIEQYKQNTQLLFSLERVENLAKNGRLPMAVAKLANLLNIRFIGKPTEDGHIKPIHYVRGARKNISKLVEEMINMGFKGEKVSISHCLNPEAAENLKNAILAKFPTAKIMVEPMSALNSYYAERGGMIIGFES